MASGIQCDCEVQNVINSFTTNTRWYCVFKMSCDEKNIVLDSVEEKTPEDKQSCNENRVQRGIAVWEKMMSTHLCCLDECRYVLFDVPCWDSEKTTVRDKLLLLSWIPDSASVKRKMLYSSSKNALTRKIAQNHKYLEANDTSEASYECALEKLKTS